MMSRAAAKRTTGLSMPSVTVRANWPAKMSHSPHGECDIDAKRTDESPGFEQPAGGADYVGSGGRLDGSELTPRTTHADRLPGSWCSFHRPWPPRPQTGQRHTCGSDRRRVVRLASTGYQGANHTHLSELLAEREGIHIGRTTLRRILLDAGLSSPRRRRPPKHRVRRQRMPRAGMLIQLDGSYHRWLADHRPPFTLLLAVDAPPAPWSTPCFAGRKTATTTSY